MSYSLRLLLTTHSMLIIQSILIRSPDIIICGDGNFTQSREKDKFGVRDYPLADTPPRTLRVSVEELERMKERVRVRRGPPSASSKSPSAKKQHTVDFEKGMRVSNEVLDLCGESYIAADEKRAKSSKKLFDDTGMFAIVCKHGRPLFWANMTEPGEQQYYMLALIHKVFSEIPKGFKVAVLYDIGCQLERSISKVS